MKLLLGLLLAGLGMGEPMRLPAIAEPAARITIRLADFAEVPDKTLSQAEGIAENVLDQAGIAITWQRCPGRPECRLEPAGAEFRLLVLNLRPLRRHGDTTGFAMILAPREDGERYAGVFFPMVQEAARNLDGDEALLLGATMAHEIGHLLLGSKAHARSGIMCPHFGHEHIRLAARGELRFTAEQAGSMRVEVMRRVRAVQLQPNYD